ncbi:response regulator transcription factor [Mycetocola sp. JXN-3]|uniref:response regulator n=1 Tax=Mycetocola sp. JXN-3 TaxID=2116510 RepID=UPI00165CFFC1|nr:response regulator transcription factor [Mycetocola sp. JXN-3]
MRIIIAEDNTLLREGLALLLESEGFEVVAAVDNAEGFLDRLDEADAAVLDVRMPPTFTNEGLRAAAEARSRRPGFPVLVLSAYVEDRYAGELLAAGAEGLGYLLKERVGRVAAFVDALNRVAAGGTVMDPEVIAQLMSRRHMDDPVRSLTPREREVLGLMAEGLDNLTIAARLFVTETAVSKHIGNIFAKLGLAATDSGHRRVLAVLAYLRDENPPASISV